jgi:hypothetical protein
MKYASWSRIMMSFAGKIRCSYTGRYDPLVVETYFARWLVLRLVLPSEPEWQPIPGVLLRWSVILYVIVQFECAFKLLAGKR